MHELELSRDAFSVRSQSDLLTRARRASGRSVDVSLLSAMMRPSRMPSAEDCARIHDAIVSAHALYAGDNVTTLTFHNAPRPVTTVVTRRSHWGLPYEQMSFDSELTMHARDPMRPLWLASRANRSGQAWMLRHPEAARPWLICLHGFGTGWPLQDFAAFRVGHLHRELGLNLILPVLPLHGPRRGPEVPLGALGSFELLETFHGIRQAVSDTRALIQWARTQGATRIGVYGMSVGAYVASLVSSLEEVELVIAGIPLCDMPDLLDHHASIEPALVRSLLGQPLRELFRLISPLELTPTAALEKRSIYAGSDDLVTTAAQAERLWHHWGRPDIHWYAGGHVSFFWSPSVPTFVSRRLRKARFVAS